jgi:hypothetical protein
MVKLIIQKKKKEKTPGTATTKSSVCLVEVLDLFLWHLILVLALGVLGFVRKGAAPLIGQLGVEMDGGFFLFFSFFVPTFLGLMRHPLQVGALKLSHKVISL